LYTNCLTKHIIEGKIKERIYMIGKGGRRHKQLLDNLKETTGTERGHTRSHPEKKLTVREPMDLS
jgi:hypothetical protein